jgi:hypothetical protein
MIIPSLSNLTSIFDLFTLPSTKPDDAIQNDDEQLATEMAEPLLICSTSQPLPDIDPDDFEELYKWFLS